jgi:hypothetical protein
VTVKKERRPAKKKGAPVLEVHDLSKQEGKLRGIGGSMSDEWNSMLADQVRRALWFFPSDDTEKVKRQRHSAIDVMIGIKPEDEFEGMIAAQLIACHNASMECYRRAMLREQTSEGRGENFSQANRLSRTYATLLEALNRHRGKGQQKVVVEHVHVHAGGQAVVGTVEAPGEGIDENQRIKLMQTKLPMHLSKRCGGGQGGEAGANRQQCQTAVAGCTAGLRREHRRAIRRTEARTLHGRGDRMAQSYYRAASIRERFRWREVGKPAAFPC